MMHENFRELIALRLYGEIEEKDRSRLQAHLSGCDACARYAREIEAGLGALSRGGRASGAEDLPADWAERLREATRETAPRRRALSWWAAAASFAAGAIATAVVARGPSSPVPAVTTGDASIWSRFHREEPPPLATTEGQLSRLTGYLGR